MIEQESERQDGLRFRAQAGLEKRTASSYSILGLDKRTAGSSLVTKEGRRQTPSIYKYSLSPYDGQALCPTTGVQPSTRQTQCFHHEAYIPGAESVRLIREYGDTKTKGDEGGEGHDGGKSRADAILNGVVREGLSEKVTSEPGFEGAGSESRRYL